MSDDRMKIPGSDHPITLVREMSRAVVRAGGRQIGETGDVLTLHESAYAPVHYVPRGDLDMNLLTRTATRTFCPYKGEASYFSLAVGDDVHPDAAWSYETPYPAVTPIAYYIAFFPGHTELIFRER